MFDDWAKQSPAVTAVNQELRFGDYLKTDWLETVAKTRDTELRCHRIALTYSKYAAFLDTWLFKEKSYWSGQLHGEPATTTNANWFHFSTWAALTVSRNIGSIAAPQRFDGWPNVVRAAVAPYIVRARGTDHQRLSQELAGAQLKIFLNTCLAFLDFCETKNVDAPNLIPADPMRDLAYRGFLFYKDAKDTDGDLQERYVLLANLLSTVVEQHLIDRQLAAGMAAVPDRIAQVAEGRIGQLMDRLLGVQRQVTEFTVASQLAPARAVATTVWGRLLTDQVFVMSLPGEMLRVGRDIPPLQRNKPYYPRSLRHPANFTHNTPDKTRREHMALLHDLVVRFDRTIEDGRGSGGARLAPVRRADELGARAAQVAPTGHDDLLAPVLG